MLKADGTAFQHFHFCEYRLLSGICSLTMKHMVSLGLSPWINLLRHKCIPRNATVHVKISTEIRLRQKTQLSTWSVTIIHIGISNYSPAPSKFGLL